MSDIGDRMKDNYERRYKHQLLRRTPAIVRVDGKAFHTFTRGMDKPFDQRFMTAMVDSARYVAGEMQGFKAAYIQSDEASFLITDYDTLATEAWFDYGQSKIESVTASLMTAWFNKALHADAPARFDARAFSIPEAEVSNYFLWRALDWERNSVAMYCRSFFSHREMKGQGRADQHEMLHSIRKNWTTDLGFRERNGTFLLPDGLHDGALAERMGILPNWADIDSVIAPLLAIRDPTP